MLDVGWYGDADVAEVSVERNKFLTAYASLGIGVWLDENGDRCEPEKAVSITYQALTTGWLWMRIKPDKDETVH